MPTSTNLVAPKVTRSAGGIRKDVRVRKARRSGACPACGRLVLVGNLIASVKGGPFTCLAHLTKEDAA